jgi:hypothetical protein
MQASQQNLINDFEPEHFLASFFRTAKAVLLSPGPFYKGMKTQGGLRNPFMFLACCVIVHSLLAGLVLKNPSLIAQNVVRGIVLPFVTSGIVFVFLTNFLKGSGTFEGAFRVNAYAAAVSLVSWVSSIGMAFGFDWIASIGLILEFYRLYLIAVGLSCAFSIKVFQALLAVLATIFIYMLLYVTMRHLTGGP